MEHKKMIQLLAVALVFACFFCIYLYACLLDCDQDIPERFVMWWINTNTNYLVSNAGQGVECHSKAWLFDRNINVREWCDKTLSEWEGEGYE